MASSDFLDDVPSSPLSPVTSDFDRSSKSPGPQASLPTKTQLNLKRKAPSARSARARASRRRKTEDSFERSLTAIKEDVILPKVAKSRQSAGKQNAAAWTESEGGLSPVEPQHAGELEMHEEVKGDAGAQLAEADRLEAMTASLWSPQDLKEGAPLHSALEIEADGGNDATEQHPSTSVHEALAQTRPAQQPAAPTVHEAAEEPPETQHDPVSSRDEIPEQTIHTQHAQQLEIELKEDATSDKEETNNDIPLPTTMTSNTFATPTVTNPPALAHGSTAETSEAEQIAKLPPPEVPDETLDQWTQEEPRTNARPSRKRLQPTKLEDYEPPAKAVPTPAKKKAQPLRGNWSVSHLLTNPKSKLATCNMNVSRIHLNS